MIENGSAHSAWCWRPRKFARRGQRSLVGGETLEPRRLFAAQFGAIDTKFGSNGIASIDAPVASDSLIANQVIVAPDGNFYVGGSSGVARFTPTGNNDTAFGTAGFAPLSSGTFVAEALDPTGYLYVLVQQGNGTALLRYKSNGNLDKSYGHNGLSIVTTDPFFTPDAMAVQPNGEPIIAGSEQTGGGAGAAAELMRVTTSGQIDSTFASTGIIEFHFGSASSMAPTIFDKVAGVNVLSDGEILVGGGSVSYGVGSGVSSPTLSKAVFATALFKSDGQLDAGYGSAGIARSKYASAAVGESIYAVLLFDATDDPNPTIQSLLPGLLPNAFAARDDGTAFVSATTGDINDVDGTFAASFGPKGGAVWERQLPPSAFATGAANALINGAAYLPDGRVVLLSGGIVTPVNPDGSVDQFIGASAIESNASSFQTGNPIAVAPDGDIVTASVGEDSPPDQYQLTAINPGSISAPLPNVFPGATASSLAYENDGSVDILYYNSAAQEVEAVFDNFGTLSAPQVVARGGPALSVTEGTDPDEGNSFPIFAYSGLGGHGVYIRDYTEDGGFSSGSTLLISNANDAVEELTIQETQVDSMEAVYYDETDGELLFSEPIAHIAGTHWVPTILARGSISAAQFVVNQSGQNTVAFVDDTLGGVYFASQSSNGTWHARLVAKTPDGAAGLSLAQDGSGEIAFQDLETGALKLASLGSDGQFTVSAVAQHLGQYTSLPDATNLYAYDARTRSVLDLYAPLGNAPSGNPAETTAITTGGEDLEVPWGYGSGTGPTPTGSIADYIDASTGDLVLVALG